MRMVLLLLLVAACGGGDDTSASAASDAGASAPPSQPRRERCPSPKVGRKEDGECDGDLTRYGVDETDPVGLCCRPCGPDEIVARPVYNAQCVPR